MILLLVGAYFAEFLADHLHTLNVTWIGMMIVGGYLVTIGVYSVVTTRCIRSGTEEPKKEQPLMNGGSENWKHCTKRKKNNQEDSRMENALLELKGKLKMLYASYGSYLLVLF